MPRTPHDFPACRRLAATAVLALALAACGRENDVGETEGDPSVQTEPGRVLPQGDQPALLDTAAAATATSAPAATAPATATPHAPGTPAAPAAPGADTVAP